MKETYLSPAERRLFERVRASVKSGPRATDSVVTYRGKRWLNVAETSRHTGLSVSSLYQHASRPTLPQPKRIRGELRWALPELVRWANARLS